MELQQIINIAYLLLLPTAFYVGYRLGKKNGSSIDTMLEKSARNYTQAYEKDLERKLTGEMKGLDAIVDDSAQPGIVYRPTAEELEKMHEPQQVKEAKEAMAETIRNTPPPEI